MVKCGREASGIVDDKNLATPYTLCLIMFDNAKLVLGKPPFQLGVHLALVS